MFGKTFDRAALASGVAPFKNDQRFEVFRLDPVLQLQKLDMKRGNQFQILLPLHLFCPCLGVKVYIWRKLIFRNVAQVLAGCFVRARRMIVNPVHGQVFGIQQEVVLCLSIKF